MRIKSRGTLILIIFACAIAVLLAATFGYDGTGGTDTDTFSTAVVCTKFNSPAGTSNITKLTAYRLSHAITDWGFRTAIYSDSSGSPLTKLAESSGATTVTSAGNWDSTLTYTLVNGTNPVVQLCVWQDSGGNGSFSYDTSGAGANQVSYDSGETYPTWPGTFTQSGQLTWRIYVTATYTTAGGGTSTSGLLLLGAGSK